MCLFSSPKNETPPPSPPPARAPASLDISNLEQTPSSARKKRSKGKRGMRNAKGNAALNVGGTANSSLSIPTKMGGKK